MLLTFKFYCYFTVVVVMCTETVFNYLFDSYQSMDNVDVIADSGLYS